MIGVLPRPRTVASGLIAGVVAGVTILAWFVFMNLVVLHTSGYTLAAVFAFDASALVGRALAPSGAFVSLGIVLHFAVSVGWALGYAIVAERQPQLQARPFISGAAFGLIVYFAMQLVLVAANLYRIPTPAELGVALLAHLAFFGVPIALIVARTRHAR